MPAEAAAAVLGVVPEPDFIVAPELRGGRNGAWPTAEAAPTASRPQPPASRPSSAVNASHAAAGLLPALAASHSSVPTYAVASADTT